MNHCCPQNEVQVYSGTGKLMECSELQQYRMPHFAWSEIFTPYAHYAYVVQNSVNPLEHLTEVHLQEVSNRWSST